MSLSFGRAEWLGEGIDTPIIPHAQRTETAEIMPVEHAAGEVLALMDVGETGKAWAKLQ